MWWSSAVTSTRPHSNPSWEQPNYPRRFPVQRRQATKCRFPTRNIFKELLSQRYSNPWHWKVPLGENSSKWNSSSPSIRPYCEHQWTWHHLLRWVERQLGCPWLTKLHSTSRYWLLRSSQHRELTGLGERQIRRSASIEQVRSHSNLHWPAYPDLWWLVVQQSHQRSGCAPWPERQQQAKMTIFHYIIEQARLLPKHSTKHPSSTFPVVHSPHW